jgi:uncharacterized protein (DUF2062 family)
MHERRWRAWARRLIEPFIALLRQGLAPRSLALCVALGAVIGNIPILGTSTVLCTLIALLARLNLPAIQLAQAAMAPTQVLLIIPFVRLGEWLTGAPHEPLSVSAGMILLAQGPWHAISVLWRAIVHAAVAFALVAPPAVALLYRALIPLFERLGRFAAAQRNPRPSTPTLVKEIR